MIKVLTRTYCLTVDTKQAAVSFAGGMVKEAQKLRSQRGKAAVKKICW
jgi:hypothetical protein